MGCLGITLLSLFFLCTSVLSQEPETEQECNPDPSWVFGTDNAPLLREMQCFIWRHQHPQDCSKAQFLTISLYNYTFSADIHMLSWALAKAINGKRVLYILPGWKHAPKDSWDDFFLPVTNCSIEHVQNSKKLQRANDLVTIDDPTTIPWESITPKPPFTEVLSAWTNTGITWWRVQTTRYFIRYQVWLLNAIVDTMNKLNVVLPQNTFCFHRHQSGLGDIMLGRGAQPSDATMKDYFEEARVIREIRPRAKHVFVTPSIAKVKEELAPFEGGTWNIIMLPEKDAIPVPTDRLNNNQDSVDAFITMVEWAFQMNCDYFVGTRLSHYFRVMDELRMSSGRFTKPVVVALNGPPEYGKIG